MPKGNGKGSSFEREISKRLSLWWTEGERDDIFWRSDQSGGRATQRAKQGKSTSNSYGDLACIDPIGQPFIDQFCIELKRGYSKDLAILPILDNPKAKHSLIEFWNQCERDRELAGRPHSMLIFKRDRMKECIMLKSSLFRKLERWHGNWELPYIRITTRHISKIVIHLNDFLNWVEPETIKRWNSTT